MIVNPQVFNYRLIIGSLIVAFSVLAVFSFTNYESVRAHQQFVEHEKKLVERELSQMIKRYDEIANTNNYLESTIIQTKASTKHALDSLRLFKSDLSVLTRFKEQLLVLKNKNNELFESFDSLKNANKNLERDNLLVHNQLKTQKDVNMSLFKDNQSLNKTIEKGSKLKANSFRANAFQDDKGTLTPTEKAHKTETIEVCFTLAENPLATTGDKELYIQIVNPKNNVLANRGTLEFGNSLLIYSSKIIVNFNNQVIDVCTNITADATDKPLTKGTYFVSVFHKDQKLGDTKIILD